VTFTTHGLDRIDTFADGHPAGSFAAAEGGTRDVPFVKATRLVEAAGFKGDLLLQRRRVPLKAY
jgi:hypothetical protein